MKTEKPPSMPFYGKQFYDDEAVWLSSLAHQGLYVALLWNQWAHGSIPADVKLIARLVGQSAGEVTRLWEIVGKHFVVLDGTDDRLINQPLEKIREEQQRIRDKRSDAASKRWSKDDANVDANIDTNTMPPNGDGVGVEKEHFEAVWKLYPRKIGKPAAERHFRSQVKTRADLAALLSAIQNYRAEIDALGTADQFVKHGATFFNAVWRDYADGSWKMPVADRKPAPKASPSRPLISERDEIFGSRK